jgi:hypothetical protein
LPLIAAAGSRIEQEQYVRLVAGRLGVSESAVMGEVLKRPTPPAEVASAEVHQPGSQSVLSPLQKKAGMLLFRFGKDSATGQRLAELLGQPELEALEEELYSQAEELRFRFDAEVGEHTTEETVAADMLGDIGKQVEKERFKMKFL